MPDIGPTRHRRLDTHGRRGQRQRQIVGQATMRLTRTLRR